MSAFSSPCGGLGDEAIGADLLSPVEHFLLLLGAGALAPRIFLLSLCLLWL